MLGNVFHQVVVHFMDGGLDLSAFARGMPELGDWLAMFVTQHHLDPNASLHQFPTRKRYPHPEGVFLAH